VHLGVTIFATDRSIRPDDLAREAEERGFESLFLPEHTHIPTSRQSPYPGGGDLPEEYRRCLDPFVALAMAGAATTRLRVGTGICLVAQRDPIVTAKEVATLDLLTGGRVVLGVGFGWNVEEMADHGVDPARRRAVVREKVLAMRALWTEDEAAFDGRHVRLSPSWAWPKPVQRPHPPVLVGGAAGPTLFRHIAEYGDGWVPIGGAGLRANLPVLREAVEEAGRDPSAVEVTVFGARPDPAVLEHHASVGVSRTVLALPSAPADQVFPILDAWAPLLGLGL
jgi:probable F420-dependent oxidoreductase